MVLASAVLFLCSAGLAQTQKPVEVITTNTVDLGAGGSIRIVGSEGDLNVEAWERPEVEVTVTRFAMRGENPKERDKAKKVLEGIRVETTKTGANEVTITSDVAGRNWLTRNYHGLTAMNINYRIRAPKDVRLNIQHGAGDVVIMGIAGGIDAHAKNGEIVVMLPAPMSYSIQAKARFGGVYSDFEGAQRHLFPFGTSFEGKSDGSAKPVILETRTGGVSVQKSE